MVIDSELVKNLIKTQFPQWQQKTVLAVDHSGWDNKTFHLGDDFIVRLPSADHYIQQVEKEQTWLPILAPSLPLPIPKPIAHGKPSRLFPRPWSIYQWIAGEAIHDNRPKSLDSIAYNLAQFLNTLADIDTTSAPLAGADNFYRGCSLKHYNGDIYQALKLLGDQVDRPTIESLWQSATDNEWQNPPVWFHGDISPGNLLVENETLVAVIDFGLTAVGDPACDLAIAWHLFDENSRNIFKARRTVDRDTWNRGRAWALWKALIIWSGIDPNQFDRDNVANRVEDIINDYRMENE